MDDVDHDDVFPTGDDSKYFDKEGQIINGKVLAADKCAHSIDMVAVHRNIEDVAGHAENINIGSRILQQIRETGSGTNAQLKMHCVVKHDGRCKAKIVVERVLCHNVNTITVDVELLGTHNTRRWRNKSNNQERNILVDGEHIWNINRSGSNNMYAYNHVSTDCINKNTCYDVSLIILAKGINRYIGEYARRNIKTAGIQNIKTADSNSSQHRINNMCMCMRGVRLQISSSGDAVYDTTNASTGEQINYEVTTIEGIDYSYAVSSCKTNIHGHDWGDIHYHIDTTKEDTSRIRAKEVGMEGYVTKVINGDQLMLGINREGDKRSYENNKYSKSIVTMDKLRDHRNPDYNNKSNGGGVTELSEFGMILVSRILYYRVRIR
jgi:hypothetical protein